jgi:hypothetical protein
MARLVLLTVALIAAVSNAFVVPALQQQAKLVAQSRAAAPVSSLRMRYVHALLLLLLIMPCRADRWYDYC